jgi:hypothetical protein
MFFDAMLKASVPCEMHILQSGGHGFGIEDTEQKHNWFSWCRYWMEKNGFNSSREQGIKVRQVSRSTIKRNLPLKASSSFQ